MHKYIYEVIGTRVPKKRGHKGRMDGLHYLALSVESGGLLTSLNKTSAVVLEMCDGENSINEIIEIFSKKYPNMSKEVLIADITKCVSDLQAMNLVTI